MDQTESFAANFIPKDLLQIICILENDEKKHSYKIIRNWSGFSLVDKFRTKNAESRLLKNSASVQKPASHQDQKQLSSEEKLRNIRRKRGKKYSSSRASGLAFKILWMSGLQTNQRRKHQLKKRGIVPGKTLPGRHKNCQKAKS